MVHINDPSLSACMQVQINDQLEPLFAFLPTTLKKVLIPTIGVHLNMSDSYCTSAALGLGQPGSFDDKADMEHEKTALQEGADGSYKLSISLQGARTVAMAFGVELRDAYLFCMANGLWPLRFIRNAGTLTLQEQEYLLRSRITIVGCGALGGYVSVLLARIGVGAFVLCDDDVFEESNLNRQLFCDEKSFGRAKTEVAQEKLLGMASHLLITPFQERATVDNLPHILVGSRALVDCVDSINSRFVLEQAALQTMIPYIHGCVAGLEGFAGISSTGDSDKSLMQSLYGSEPTATNEKKVIEEIGLFAPTASGIATLQAVLTVRALLSGLSGEPIEGGRLLHLDVGLPAIDIFRMH